ncbi:MAG TPA: hypothetical protein VMS18_06040 [Candidatus Binatia bacterium]|nr:hypothetical protein [Candidatus Binatia bacterium]
MSSADNQGSERDVKEKIVRLMQSVGQGPQKPIPSAELRKLKSAANRLDQMLKAGEEADQQTLKSAAARLGRLLSDIHAGQDIAANLKRRRNTQSSNE